MKVSRPTLAQLKELERLSPAERRSVMSLPYSFLLWFSYYYSPFLKAPFADYHLQFAEDLGDLVTGVITELCWSTFRESGKSSFAKAFLVQCIANEWFMYPNVDSHQGENSERFLFDVVNTLQTNSRIRFDYSELFNQEKRTLEKTQKRITDFVATNGIRCESHTTGESVRGRLHKEHRPDLVIFEDFETMNTIRSEASTREVREHISEFRGGVDQKRGRIMYLCNYLSDEGNVASLFNSGKDNPMFRGRKIWLLNEEGKPTWPERYVLTDDELRLNPEKTCIENMRLAWRKDDTGDSDFEREMMGCPTDPWGNGPDSQNYIPLLPDFDPTFSEFTPMPPHVIGVDPGGDGDDETAIVVRSQFQAFIYAREKKSTGKSIASLVLQAMREYDVPAESVVIDSFGVGFKCVQELSLMGHHVKAMNVGESTEGCALDDERSFNDRACIYFRLKEWLASGGALSPDPVWAKQAKTLRFTTDGHNKRRILPKKEIIKRGFRSPDIFDSLALTFAVPLEPENLTPTTVRSNVSYRGRWSKSSMYPV